MRAGWLAAAAVAVGFAGAAHAADPLEVAPEMYRSLFENERVRIMEVTFEPGAKIAEHTHPSPHAVYVLQPGTLKITKQDGTSSEVSPSDGDVLWIPAETHSAVNPGDTTVQLLVIEVKDYEPKKDGPPTGD